MNLAPNECNSFAQTSNHEETYDHNHPNLPNIGDGKC